MKKYLFQLFYGILVFMIASCTNSETPKLPDAESFDGSYFLISMDDARNELNQLLLDQETAYSRTGTNTKRVIESCYTRSLKLSSRSEYSNFPIYVFNFADNEGFAIMSSDKRTPSLLALAENGNLSDTTEIDNPGFNMYMNLLSAGDVIPNPGTIWTYDGIEYGPWSNLFYTNFLTCCDVKWGQRNPYNKYCPKIDGTSTLTGCVSTAVAQLMATYKYPESYSDYSFNWNEMTAKPKATGCSAVGQNQIARLMQQLGLKENLDAEYGVKSTPTPMATIPRTLQNFGYSNGGSYVPYDTDDVVNELSDHYPVIVSGWTKNYEVGHCWLLHGLLRRTRTVKVHDLETGEVTRTYTETLYYPQCNWGWNGQEDGYYLNGVFNISNGASFSDEFASGVTGTTHNPNYTYDFKYSVNTIIGIRK